MAWNRAMFLPATLRYNAAADPFGGGVRESEL
jgi:hypothetical protein